MFENALGAAGGHPYILTWRVAILIRGMQEMAREINILKLFQTSFGIIKIENGIFIIELRRTQR